MSPLWIRFYAHWLALQFRVSQYLTYPWASLFPRIAAVSSLTELVVRLSYSDAGARRKRYSGGMRHPRSTQRYLDETRIRFGSGDDYVAYWIATLLRSGLADRVRYGRVFLEHREERTARPVCLFKRHGEWYLADYSHVEYLKDPWSWPEAMRRRWAPEGRVRGAFHSLVSLDAHDGVKFEAHSVYPCEETSA